MPDFLLENVALWLSKQPEPVLNNGFTLATDFLKALTVQPAYILPQVQFVNDAGKPGNGHEFPTRQCPTYIGHPAISFTDDINVDYAGRLLMRALGGVVTDAQQGGTAAWKHSNSMLDALVSRQLPSTSMISQLGGASFRLDGMVVDRYRLSQNRADPPQYAVDLVGSGKFVNPQPVGIAQVETATAAGTIGTAGNATVIVTAAGMPGSPRTLSVAVAAADAPATWAQKVRDALTADQIVSKFFVVSGATTSIVLTARIIAANDTTMNISLDNGTCTGITPALTSANTTAGSFTLPATANILTCLDGNNSVVTWTDQFGLQTFTGTSCTIRSWFIEVANNSKLNDRCPGDPTIAITDGSLTTNPAYVGKMRHGARVVTAQIVILLDSIIPDWLTFATNDVLTDVTFKAQGAIIASTFRFALNMIMPKARITSIETGENDCDAVLTINLTGFYDSVSNSALKAEVVNTETSLYA
jgi:hypothetical protein